eukprot:gnl/Trimastix_PCT/2799.p2 GENE.gnl/Trimastix_PCT/2799~~gnl/Trimastix_PCT/2799.p2  ORF type:complete len:525 (+),score=135.69 gnl/Trimastix_PCT/2799:99-1577(+)
MSNHVNATYRPYETDPLPPPRTVTEPTQHDAETYAKALQTHEGQAWTKEETLRQAIREHSIFSWNDDAKENFIMIERGEGVYFWDHAGKRYMDFNSGAMCVHFGYSNPAINEAIIEQLNKIQYTYGKCNATPTKAKLCDLLARICPGDISHFYFPTGGSDSNETALRMARAYTGRSKVVSRYRSYHGAGVGTLALTGDSRRWHGESLAMGGVVHVVDPFPYTFRWGETDAEITAQNLAYIREVIEYEGPNNIAAIFVEPITGTNGVLKPPVGYLEGIRALCDEIGALMICDEVMSGFGRTGKLFGFMHSSPCVIPDIVTMAKGINGASVPLGCVAMRTPVAEFFRTHALGVGQTYNAHPLGIASAYGAVQYLIRDDLVGRAARLGEIMKRRMEALASRHACILQARCLGLFGIIDLQNPQRPGFPLAGKALNAPMHPAMKRLKEHCLTEGLWSLFRWNQVYCNPPLVVTEEQLEWAFDVLDRGLALVDEFAA